MKKENKLIAHCLTEALTEIQGFWEQNNYGITGTPTGFSDLDKLTCGMHPGNLITVGAAPGAGKTTFVLNIAEWIGMHSNKAVAIFSTENTTVHITKRLLASLGRMDITRIRSGQLEGEDFPRLSSATAQLNGRKIFINDTHNLTLDHFRECLQKIHFEYGDIGLIVVDNLQSMTIDNFQGERSEELAIIMRGLKVIAQDFNTPIMITSQINKAVNQRIDRRPELSDLLGSSSIENDSDLVIFIYRDELYNSDSLARGTAEIIISKNRNGVTGEFRLTFLGHYSRFENFANSSNIPKGAYDDEFFSES